MERIQKLATKLAGYVGILISLVSGFYIGTQFYRLEPKPEYRPSLKRSDEVSIAINEANQLMLIDRRTGKYEIYTDSVGFSIFRMYASKIYQNKTTN